MKLPIVNEQTLRDLVAEYKAQGGAYRQKVQEVMRSSYRNHYRQILPALLEVLDFHSNNTAYQPVIEALAIVREYVSSRIAWYPLEVSPPLEGVVPDSWENIVTDGQSEIGFAFSHLLGFRLLPRLKPIHSQKLALVEVGTQDDYPHLKEALGKPINWEKIAQQYDMMVKYASALKTGTAEADALLRRFTRSNLQQRRASNAFRLPCRCVWSRFLAGNLFTLMLPAQGHV